MHSTEITNILKHECVCTHNYKRIIIQYRFIKPALTDMKEFRNITNL